MSDIEIRKQDHIDLAGSARIPEGSKDSRFCYEPLFGVHPSEEAVSWNLDFLGSKMDAPVWISSMTGGGREANTINRRLAAVASEFGLGMGLGSCRALLENPEVFDDFNLRPIIGGELPFYANLGIAQVDELLRTNQEEKIIFLVESLRASGLVIHLNPLQEWLQPGGDRYTRPAFETLQDYFSKMKIKTIVKEVGQGMGPRTLAALLDLPVAAIEFAAFGGTNFSLLELKRAEDPNTDFWRPLCNVGHTAIEMVEMINMLETSRSLEDKSFIISGGVNNFLDGFHLMNKLNASSAIGMAGAFLTKAREGEEELRLFCRDYILGLEMARQWLS